MVYTEYQILPHITFGSPTASNRIVCLSGFPDDETSAFKKLFSLINPSKDDVFILSMCLPSLENHAHQRPWGYDQDEIMTLLQATISHYFYSESITFNFLIHDWGSYYGLVYANRFPNRISKLIDLDVGLVSKPSLKQMLIIVIYQWWYALAYILSQTISKSLGTIFFFSYIYLVPFQLKPVPVSPPRSLREVKVHQNYLYYIFWKNALFSPKKLLKPRFPTVPTLFLYGKRKNIMFHSKSFIDRLNSTDGCKVIEVDSGHWIADEKPEIVWRAIREFTGI